VVLKGRGVAAILEVDSVIDFGSVPVGDSVIDSLPLKNVGNIDFGVCSSFSSVPATVWIFPPSHECVLPFMPDSIFELEDGIPPQKPGRRTAVAEIAADGGGAPQLCVCHR